MEVGIEYNFFRDTKLETRDASVGSAGTGKDRKGWSLAGAKCEMKKPVGDGHCLRSALPYPVGYLGYPGCTLGTCVY